MSTRLKLKGRTLFVIALLTIGITILTVYVSGIDFNRSLSTNLYISLSIIAFFLFLFLAYGLHRGIIIENNYPKFRNYEIGSILSNVNFTSSDSSTPSFDFDVGEGLVGILISILLWIGLTILIVVLLIVFEAIFWLSLFIIFASIYWVFLRAIKVVFYKSRNTMGDLPKSVFLAFRYTILYTGWIYGLVLISSLIGK